MTKTDKTALLDRIYKALETPQGVERAIVLLANLQTKDELLGGVTSHHNGVGFSGADASVGAFLARVIQENTERGFPPGKRLRGKALEMGSRVARKYARTQLFQAAVAKAA